MHGRSMGRSQLGGLDKGAGSNPGSDLNKKKRPYKFIKSCFVCTVK
jgi:hypothetical protein